MFVRLLVMTNRLHELHARLAKRDAYSVRAFGLPATGKALVCPYEFVRKHGISNGTFYRWKSKYGEMEVTEAKRLLELESENAKLKKLLAETMLHALLRREGLVQNRKRTQNAFVESFNGRFRDGCPNQHWFRSLEEARQIIETWRQDYSEVRPHSSLNHTQPARFEEADLLCEGAA